MWPAAQELLRSLHSANPKLLELIKLIGKLRAPECASVFGGARGSKGGYVGHASHKSTSGLTSGLVVREWIRSDNPTALLDWTFKSWATDSRLLG